jgi:2-hydroxy-3-keto-5-methylthiopentenyl-1-phosphate phosphatase
MPLKVFVDFDGTITQQDVGDAFFLRFGGPVCASIVGDYREGKISAAECFRRELAQIGDARKGDMDDFFRQQPIDTTFHEFAAFCRRNGIAFHVVSDGLDYYIRSILEANGLSDVSFFSNTLLMVPSGGDLQHLGLEFPFSDADCSRCACCKRNILLTHTDEADIIAYVGEGYSDRCPAQYADLVFAKDDLQKFCQKENISHFVYSSFHDVAERLNLLLVNNRLRKRRRAELKRREAFACE